VPFHQFLGQSPKYSIFGNSNLILRVFDAASIDILLMKLDSFTLNEKLLLLQKFHSTYVLKALMSNHISKSNHFNCNSIQIGYGGRNVRFIFNDGKSLVQTNKMKQKLTPDDIILSKMISNLLQQVDRDSYNLNITISANELKSQIKKQINKIETEIAKEKESTVSNQMLVNDAVEILGSGFASTNRNSKDEEDDEQEELPKPKKQKTTIASKTLKTTKPTKPTNPPTKPPTNPTTNPPTNPTTNPTNPPNPPTNPTTNPTNPQRDKKKKGYEKVSSKKRKKKETTPILDEIDTFPIAKKKKKQGYKKIGTKFKFKKKKCRRKMITAQLFIEAPRMDIRKKV